MITDRKNLPIIASSSYVLCPDCHQGRFLVDDLSVGAMQEWVCPVCRAKWLMMTGEAGIGCKFYIDARRL